MKRRVLSILCALALCLGLLPITALADEVKENVPYIYYTWDQDNQELTKHTDGNAAAATVVTENDTVWSGTGTTNGWYVVSGTVEINSRVIVSGTVYLILADGCELTVNGGIRVAQGSSLTIYGQSGGTGQLTAQNPGSFNAAIGGNGNSSGGDGEPAGAITIHGGIITATATATSYSYGAGIGGGGGGTGGQVTIYGGTVTATGSAGIGGGNGNISGGGTVTIHGGTINATGNNGAGIGDDYESTITISGGTVEATGGTDAAGIGGYGGTVTISGGTVTATGGTNAAGIGGGSGGNITITGGTVKATGGSYGAGIGGGGDGGSETGGAGGTITISGGTITATGGSNGGAGIGGGIGGIYGGSGGTVTISGGTVTATGGSTGAGIGGGSNSSGTLGEAGSFSTGDSGSAVIFASGSSAIQDTEDSEDPWQGVIFLGDSGAVYGDTVTPTEDFTIPSGKTLEIGEKKTLNIKEGVILTILGTINVEANGTITNQGTINVDKDGTLTNQGTVNNYGTVDNSGTINNSGHWINKVTGITLPGPQSLTVDGKTTLIATVTWGTVTENPVPNVQVEFESLPWTWASNTPGVATVAADSTDETKATVTAVSAGTAEITVKADTYQATCAVTVIQPVTGVSLNKTALSLTVGSSETLTATVAPDDASNQGVTWSSSNSSVATVDSSGKVTALREGTATITATTVDGQQTATCAVTVTQPDDGTPTYSVSWPRKVEGGTVTVKKSYAQEGETFRFTLTPDEGYELAALAATDSRGRELDLTDEGGGAYSFQMPASRVEVQVSFRESAAELPFTDVDETAWYAEAVRYVYQNGLMSGVSDTAFAPDAVTSRSMIAAILWRMAGSPAVDYAMDFADVPQGQWYSEAIRWAASAGIVSGYGDTFGTDDPITREQFAVMLWQFAKDQGVDVSVGEDTNILSYADFEDLSDWAVPAMQWACGAGIISGTGDGSTLSPQAQATRAQAAVMLKQFGTL